MTFASIRNRWTALAAAAVLTIALIQSAAAQGTPPTNDRAEAQQAEVEAAVDAARKAGTLGPSDIPLLDEAKLALPSNMIFVPSAEAGRVLRAWGNRPGSDLVGLIAGGGNWSVIVTYIKDGYVRDDEAKTWNPDELLAGLKEGTEAGNTERVARGFPPLELLGWLEPPAYDAATHRLTWALRLRSQGTEQHTVNYNTRVLGRDGYFSLNLLTDEAHFATDRQIAQRLLGELAYGEGKRYEDFNVSTDHVAEYGIAALIGIVAAKKLGFIALAGVFLLKFAKIGLLAVAGFGGVAARFFRRKPKPLA